MPREPEPSLHARAGVTLLVAAGAVFLARAAAPPQTTGVFEEVAARAGLVFVHDNGARGQFFLPEIMGSGVAVLDADRDGDLDVFFVQGAPLLPDQRPRDLAKPGHRLFRNDGVVGGLPRFTDVTDRAGVGVSAPGMGAAVGDVDDDGAPDLLVTGFARTTLFRNRGDGTFADVTAAAGLADDGWPTSAAFFDYDRDGRLDVFVARYVAFTVAGNKPCADPVGERDYCAPAAYRPVPDRLYRNEGGGRFADVTAKAGIVDDGGAGLGVATADLDGDRWLDVYVANDATPNHLWGNLRDGTFQERGLLSGTSVNLEGRPEGSMGIALGDADGDGDEDLFVTNIVGETHVLYVNDGKGNFEDVRVRSGLARPTAPMTGFGTAWVDADLDGPLDLFLTSGSVNVLESQRGTGLPFRQRSQLFRNDGRGTFTEVGDAAGEVFGRLGIGRGVAAGDLDNDGDTDVVVSHNAGAAWLLVNRTLEPGVGAGGDRPHWLGVGLRSAGGNGFGLGARVGIVRDGQPTLWRRARTDGSYLSASDPRVLAGLGRDGRPPRIRVEWPDGSTESFGPGAIDAYVVLEKGHGTREK